MCVCVCVCVCIGCAVLRENLAENVGCEKKFKLKCTFFLSAGRPPGLVSSLGMEGLTDSHTWPGTIWSLPKMYFLKQIPEYALCESAFSPVSYASYTPRPMQGRLVFKRLQVRLVKVKGPQKASIVQFSPAQPQGALIYLKWIFKNGWDQELWPLTRILSYLEWPVLQAAYL